MADKKDEETEKAEVDPKVSESGLPEEETSQGGEGAEGHLGNRLKKDDISADLPGGDAQVSTAVTEDVAEAEADTQTEAEPVLTAPEHDPREATEAEEVKTADAGLTGAEAEAMDEPDATSPAPETGATDAAVPPETQVVVEKRGGFGPAILGGVVAAVIGFGLAIALFPEGTPFGDKKKEDVTAALEQALAQQKADIAALRQKVEAAPDTSGLDALGARLEELASGLKGANDGIDQNTASLSNLASQLQDLSASAVSENVSEQARQAYEAELSKLQDTMADQRAEIEQMINESQKMKADAAATALETRIRANLTQISTALDSGDPFGTQLQALASMGLQIPQDLQAAAAAGVATMAQLRADFPDYARDALNATRDNGDTSSVMSFLKNQLGARSLTPREGDDPDAILSRAEDALRKGQLQAALDELEALPEAAQVEIEPWLTQAVARAKAIAGLQSLQSANQSN